MTVYDWTFAGTPAEAGSGTYEVEIVGHCSCVFNLYHSKKKKPGGILDPELAEVWSHFIMNQTLANR